MDIDETILIDDGSYAARTYKVDDYMAMWLVGVGIVQFYDAEGNMLLHRQLLEKQGTAGMAASNSPLSRRQKCVRDRRYRHLQQSHPIRHRQNPYFVGN